MHVQYLYVCYKYVFKTERTVCSVGSTSYILSTLVCVYSYLPRTSSILMVEMNIA